MKTAPGSFLSGGRGSTTAAIPKINAVIKDSTKDAPSADNANTNSVPDQQNPQRHSQHQKPPKKIHREMTQQ